MAERLCPTCIPEGVCKFRIKANETANNTSLTPEEKQARILGARLSAREFLCPNLNDIDPRYPGVEGL